MAEPRGPEFMVYGLVWYWIFVLSTVCHEAAHALVAKWGGDRTADHAGQVSLDPMPHIRREPIGMVLVPLLTYFTMGWMMGWASAPYDPVWARRHPHRASLMALAGPVANLLLALCAGSAIRFGLQFGWFDVPADGSLIGGSALLSALGICFLLNVLLFAFNLMPLPPLDGSSVLGLLMPENMARTWQDWMHTPGLSFLTLFLAWKAFPPVAGVALGIAMTLLTRGLPL